jgi:hypothetical protein
LRLTDAKPTHKTKNLTIIHNVKSKLGRNYLFVFLKKKLSNTEKNPTKSFKILLILIQIEKKAKNTEGPLRSILKDMLVDERMKLPLRFSQKKII